MGEQIVLGLGDNIDYEIRWDSSIIEAMIRDFGLSDSELTIHAEIKTRRDLLVSILGFLKNGTGGERFVHHADVIEEFSHDFEKKITLGGTAVRSAIAMRKLGFTSAVHLVTMNEHVQRLVPRDCTCLCSNDAISSYPHLIVQFRAGTGIHANDIHIETNRANRIIYTNDKDNSLMYLHPALPDLLTDAKVFLISGFNCMYDAAMLEDRLRFLQRTLDPLRGKTAVFFEDGCYHHPEMSPIVRAYLLKYIDIYSLNEDEFESYLGRSISWTDAEAVGSALEDLQKIIPAKTLIVHTRYWALAWGADALAYKKALAGGITMATSRFRFGDDFTRKDYAETAGLPLEEPGKIFSSEIQALLGNKVCCVPSFSVSEKKVTTIGLGDTFVGGFLPALI
jgi:ADP-dependent phosphofructokinase/glucokinase